MPRTTKKPKPQPEIPSSPGTTNGLVGEVLTLPETASYLRLSEAQVIELTHSQALPGRLIAGEWRFLKAAIQQWLSSGSPSRESRKAAQLALAGKYKDDPDLARICEEAYRNRRSSASEGD